MTDPMPLARFALLLADVTWNDTDAQIQQRRQVLLDVSTPKGTEPKPCGTLAAVRRHERSQEPLCDPCRNAKRQYAADNYRVRKQLAAAREAHQKRRGAA